MKPTLGPRTTAAIARYVNEHEAAAILGLKRGTLSNWRSQGRGPAYSRLNGGRVIRYKLSDIEAFAARDRINPEGDRRGAAR
jgi:predicted DNA-binding transcriptional regulator AlpA